MPLLHRPLFEAQLQAGLYRFDPHFLAVVLLVCAIGARFVRDDDHPRVLSEPGNVHSAGWQWFDAAEPMNRVPILFRPKLFDLQLRVVSAMDTLFKI